MPRKPLVSPGTLKKKIYPCYLLRALTLALRRPELRRGSPIFKMGGQGVHENRSSARAARATILDYLGGLVIAIELWIGPNPQYGLCVSGM